MSEKKWPFIREPEGASLAWLRNFLVSSLATAKARQRLQLTVQGEQLSRKSPVSYYEPFEFIDHESHCGSNVGDITDSASLCDVVQQSVPQLTAADEVLRVAQQVTQQLTIPDEVDHPERSGRPIYSPAVDSKDATRSIDSQVAAYRAATNATGAIHSAQGESSAAGQDGPCRADTTDCGQWPVDTDVQEGVDESLQWQFDGAPGGQPCDWAVDSSSFVSAGTGDLPSEMALVSETDINADDEAERRSDANTGSLMENASVGETSQSLYEEMTTPVSREDKASNEIDIWSAHSGRSRMRWSDDCVDDFCSIGSAGHVSNAEYESVKSNERSGTPPSGIYHSVDGNSVEHFSSGQEDLDEAHPKTSERTSSPDGGTGSAAWRVDTSSYLHAVSVTGRGNVNKSSNKQGSWTPGLRLWDQKL